MSDFHIKVIKLGGTSQNLIPYQNAKKYIGEYIDKKYKIFIVVSALSGITNLLSNYKDKDSNCKEIILQKHFDFIKKFNFDDIYTRNLNQQIEFIINYIFNNINDINKNEIYVLGENLSSIIFNAFLNYPHNKKNIKSKVIMATNILSYISKIKNLSNLAVDTEQIIKNFIDNDVIVTQGFTANDMYGKTTVLMGRGSSDTSGAIFAKYLNAQEYQIWTDVSGIYNIDPRLTDSATKIYHINFELAQEMAGMGAKILHPYCIKPCQKANIPILIKNSFDISQKPTIIDNNIYDTIGFLIQKDIYIVKIISITMWHGVGFAAHIFNIFADNKLDIDIITTSSFEITVSIKNDNNLKYLYKAIRELEKSYSVKLLENCYIVSVVSNNILHLDKLPKIHQISLKYDIKLESISSNNHSISFGLVDKAHDFLLELYNLNE